MIATRKSKLVDSICRGFGLVLFCGLLLMAGATAPAVPVPPKASPVAPKPSPQPRHVSGSIIKNPHLKGVEQAAVHVQQKVKKVEAVTHHPWHRRWDYRAWFALHRGLGIVRGFVHAPDGAPVGSAKVLLRHVNGTFFVHAAMKHLTYTDSQGNFIMVGVRAGRYRVVSLHGKLKGHALIAVHPGFASNVAIKI
jgi:hypothetical protein